MRKYQGVVLSEDNLGPVVGASVAVYTIGTLTLASLYSDNGSTLTTNPVITNAAGEFWFYINDGRYDITVSGLGITTKTLTDIMIVDNLVISVGGHTYPFEVRADDPNTSGWGTSQSGRTWYNTTDGQTKQWNGSEIVIL